MELWRRDRRRDKSFTLRKISHSLSRALLDPRLRSNDSRRRQPRRLYGSSLNTFPSAFTAQAPGIGVIPAGSAYLQPIFGKGLFIPPFFKWCPADVGRPIGKSESCSDLRACSTSVFLYTVEVLVLVEGRLDDFEQRQSPTSPYTHHVFPCV